MLGTSEGFGWHSVPVLYWVFAMHTMPELMCAAFPGILPVPDLVFAIACGTLYPHSHALQCPQHQPHACYQECICQIGACSVFAVMTCAALDAHGLLDNCRVLST